MTLSDLEWPFHASRAISAVAELLVVISQQLHVEIQRYQPVTQIAYLMSRELQLPRRNNVKYM